MPTSVQLNVFHSFSLNRWCYKNVSLKVHLWHITGIRFYLLANSPNTGPLLFFSMVSRRVNCVLRPIGSWTALNKSHFVLSLFFRFASATDKQQQKQCSKQQHQRQQHIIHCTNGTSSFISFVISILIVFSSEVFWFLKGFSGFKSHTCCFDFHNPSIRIHEDVWITHSFDEWN